jgi:bifunctional non-homologous end joining protein LigD
MEGLAEYQRKRDFETTKEPRGAQSNVTPGLSFVVQKHAASRLHYDFRLEVGGVLVSWAIPRGPSLNPADKRLAMKVEDHPLEYGGFEGLIDPGNYGAGSVIIWDKGTFTPDPPVADPVEAETILAAGLEKGELKFILHGSKLTGSWALVKIRGREPNTWLLLKHKDGSATTADVTSQAASVVSGRTLEDVESGDDTGLADAPIAAMPASVSPMLASLAESPFDGPEWWFEVKWDGYRIMAYVEDGEVRLVTRNGQDYTARYQEVAEELSRLGADCVLDGEMVVVDENGKANFGMIADWPKSRRGSLVYYVFDVPYAYGRDLKGLALARRKQILTRMIQGFAHVRLSDHVEGDGKGLFEIAVAQGLEGVMAKRADSPYLEGKRGSYWQKIKTHMRQEAVICGYTEPKGGRSHLGALILGLYEDGNLRFVGHAGGGFGEQDLDKVWRLLEPLATKDSPFSAKVATNGPAHWVKPELLCEVQFLGWTEDGHMRQPVFIGMREDKAAQSAVREAVVDKKEKDEGEVSHRDKVYWPKDGITKGQLADYYASIAPTILPYLSQRPESLHRHPGGISGKDFFQKDVASHPDWVKTVPIHSESGEKDVHWVICSDARTLEYLVSLGCIELNPWLSRVSSLDRPDWCLLDIDAKTNDFSAVVEVARCAREILQRYDIAAGIKTSGKTGMHIGIPLGAKYTYEQSRQFVQIIMQLVHAELPTITSVDRSPAKREAKIYLDYLQNRHGQTMAAPYCVRPVDGAPVSMPIRWDELTDTLDPRAFTILNAFGRVQETGDLWAPVLGPGVDLTKILGAMSK